jgi:N6-adenosine-specific RNA methylase IME4
MSVLRDVTPRFKKASREIAPRYGLDLPGTLSKTGWTPPRGLSFDEWKQIGRALVTIEGRVQWAIGDWWCAGHAYGERAKAWAEGEFGELSFGTLMTYGSVARQIETSIRIEVLSFAHHQIVASLPPADQAKWLARADKEGWTVKELRTALAKWTRGLKHEAIKAGAKTEATNLGPFPLIYADPPWEFITHSDTGNNRMPDNHYPTLTDDEIAAFEIAGKTIPELAHHDAALFLWCTSSNIMRAAAIMAAWGFTYKSQAVWVKDRTGTGYIFLNQHEVLLYGTRGNMPAPLWLPPSAFFFTRGRHSEKPVGVREAIARMYPLFGQSERAELFARGGVPGWTTYGYEARP